MLGCSYLFREFEQCGFLEVIRSETDSVEKCRLVFRIHLHFPGKTGGCSRERRSLQFSLCCEGEGRDNKKRVMGSLKKVVSSVRSSQCFDSFDIFFLLFLKRIVTK